MVKHEYAFEIAWSSTISLSLENQYQHFRFHKNNLERNLNGFTVKHSQRNNLVILIKIFSYETIFFGMS